ncbi:hypothetical protein P8452_64048 [Trifolium repens]|nr:hypothetical protein P8452_64048 [Trifolium repens]
MHNVLLKMVTKWINVSTNVQMVESNVDLIFLNHKLKLKPNKTQLNCFFSVLSKPKIHNDSPLFPSIAFSSSTFFIAPLLCFE